MDPIPIELDDSITFAALRRLAEGRDKRLVVSFDAAPVVPVVAIRSLSRTILYELRIAAGGNVHGESSARKPEARSAKAKIAKRRRWRD